MSHTPSIREQIYRTASVGGVVSAPPGSELDLLRRGRPVTLSAYQLEGYLAEVDRPVDLSLSDAWVLTGDNVLTPA